ncbi:MAG TPA: DUF3592 domain-containing protein [Nitrospiraceae bacterium]|nr:DUF3592 domain-containing protein [Nitrospiraceae bacterium]
MPGLSVFTTLRRSFLLWFGTIFLGVGLMAMYFAMDLWRTHQHFEQEAVSVQATILSKSLEKASREGNPRTRYLVTYRFAPTGNPEIDKTSEVSVDEWERLDEGSPLPVRYLPSDPTTTQLDGRGEWWEPLMLGGFGVLFSLIGIVIAWSDLRHVLLVRRLSQQGLPAEGTIRNVWATGTRINRVTQWKLSYEFRDHMGRIQQGESHLLSPDEAATWKPGDKGFVRFDRSRPHESVWIGRSQS